MPCPTRKRRPGPPRIGPARGWKRPKFTGGPGEVVTDLAILGFDEASKRMRVDALHPGVTRDQVQDNTGFSLGSLPIPGTGGRKAWAEM